MATGFKPGGPITGKTLPAMSLHPAAHEVYSIAGMSHRSSAITMFHPADLATATGQSSGAGSQSTVPTGPSGEGGSGTDTSGSTPAGGSPDTSPLGIISNSWGALMLLVVAVIFISAFHAPEA
jgi:hypothetical protein